MKEHPILFTGPNVRAIWEERKTQTRRVLRLPRHSYQGDATAAWVGSVNPDGRDGWVAWGPTPMTDEQSKRMYSHGGGFRCPYGVVGDHLWVRERALYWMGGAGGISDVVYAGDPEIPLLLKDNGKLLVTRETLNAVQRPVIGKWCWRPSIFMPRWASRLSLAVNQIRAQRLQDITEEDAQAEGVVSVAAYRSLWDSINRKRHPWESNPFVWVLDFRRAVREATR